ncbi:hypothetical protein [Mangrovimonas sp. TPBH4]|uniref:hypothetical protein n=1 Tax=Mangrovimonas sp. TPBH4 TaxID=1645914 RepID=UPI0006B59E87|nr:hypothetical protein [Mangrovimonas sp. TPBH4]
MFLNLTNHPSSQWEQAQLQAAKKYGVIVDFRFPEIDPKASSQELEQLADALALQIEQLNPKAVHLMGELTFTFMLVNKLHSKKIPCLASTTKRLTTESSGVKTSVFKFVQFRPYL